MLYGCLVPTKSAGKVIEYAFKLISCTVHSWYANGILRSMNGRMSQKGLKHSPSWDGLNNKHTCQPKCDGSTTSTHANQSVMVEHEFFPC